MKKCKRFTVIILSTLIIGSVSAAPSFAAENAIKTVYEDALYGGLAGTLVGAAFMAFTKKPADHFNYILYGAAGGVLAGTAYGVVTTTKSMAEIENGKVKFAVPTIVPELQEQKSVMLKAELLRGSF